MELGPAQQRAVLAALLVDAGRPVPLEELAARVWDRPPKGARSALYAHLSRLRGLLADMASEQVFLERMSTGYALHVPRDRVDVLRFQDLVAEGGAADVSRDRRAAALGEALRLWRGAPLAGLDTIWAANMRHSWEIQRTTAAAMWAATELDLDRPESVISQLTMLVPSRPLAESLVYELMRALHRTGRTAEALDWYDRTRKHLAQELGSDPGKALQELHMAILMGTADGRRRPPEDEPKARPETPVPAQLPAYAPGFTGRADHLQRLDRFLDSGQRTIVISGAAGVGKTTLAAHWAHQVRERFPDGQLYVNLHGFSGQMPMQQPAEVLARFLQTLGVPRQEVPIDLDDAAALFRSIAADKRILVLLDNAASADQVRPLLLGSVGCLVLVTSRNRLSRLVAWDGARRLNLDVMTEPEAVELLSGLLGDDYSADDPALRDLATACGCLPLALRISAARLSDRPDQRLADFVAALYAGDRLNALAVADDDRIAVQAAFDLSYEALPETARRLFGLVGAFAGPDFSTAPVAALTGLSTEDADRSLDQLAAMHMIQPVAGNRHTFHDLLRLYAQRRCATEIGDGERRQALRRLCEFYLAVVDAAAKILYPQVFRLPRLPDRPVHAPVAFTDHRQAKAWLDAERENLVTVAERAMTNGLHEPAWLLADWLRGYLGLQQPFRDWFALAETGLAAAAINGDLLGQAAAHHSLAQACHSISRFEEALEHLAKARALSAEGNWLEGHTAALCNFGVVYADIGRLREAREQFTQALEANQRAGSLVGTAVNLENLGDVHRLMNDLDEAVGCYAAAHTLYTEIGSPPGQASTLTSMGAVHHALGDPSAAAYHAERGLAMHRESGNQLGQAAALTTLARIRCAAGGVDAAIESARAAIAISLEFGDHRTKADAYTALAEAYALGLRGDEALRQYEIAYAVASAANIPYQRTLAVLGLIRMRADWGDATDRALAERALETARRAGFRALEDDALSLLARFDVKEVG
ncbi:AfsR/SARP family transcriptional regulator [Micromonospora okii]|uniref:AfsR/SARP family transcriptional regulator n=1 Tax=Micromonospora okii TaxID=1182970 RepID=UPI001E2E9C33|nr:BTAD domain-containing putative transcriptional regulator [Micromonospora okii]